MTPSLFNPQGLRGGTLFHLRSAEDPHFFRTNVNKTKLNCSAGEQTSSALI